LSVAAFGLLVALAGFFSQSAAQAQQQNLEFRRFLESLWPAASAKGVARETFDTAFSGLVLDSHVPGAASHQAEFDRPLKAYLAEAVSSGRVERGRLAWRQWRSELSQIEAKFGVPAEIVLAAWGMESDYGRSEGDHDAIRTLASLAFLRSDRSLFLDELIAALEMLQKAGVARANMRGSWAGAMGGSQFLPSAYLKYAVSFDGKGVPDIWTSPPDTLASIANFLRQEGWAPGLVWGMEVIVPQGFDDASLHRSFGDWARIGVRSATAQSFPPTGEATLFFPSGATGPAFLLADNYWVLKQYNNSDSYALSLASLATRLAGGGELQGRWPKDEVFLSRTQKAAIQRRLVALDLYKGTLDGRFGPASRDAIHAYQIAHGIHPADGFATPALFKEIVGGP